MPLTITFPSASLAATILASTIGTYIALSPPHPPKATKITTTTSSNNNNINTQTDAIKSLNLTSKHTTKLTLFPLFCLSLHTSALALYYPTVPSFLLPVSSTTQNLNLHQNLVTWSPATAIPLALIICAGIPLRLIPYKTLGSNFTFALSQPSHLTTSGIYAYIQHPSYSGLLILLAANSALLFRIDGVISCWIPEEWYSFLRGMEWILAPVAAAVVLWGVGRRVGEEEEMLEREFGVGWERWNRETKRFIPFVL